jgi:hypothetical protein
MSLFLIILSFLFALILLLPSSVLLNIGIILFGPTAYAFVDTDRPP